MKHLWPVALLVLALLAMGSDCGNTFIACEKSSDCYDQKCSFGEEPFCETYVRDADYQRCDCRPIPACKEPLDCDDAKECTDNVCSGFGTCSNPPVVDGTACAQTGTCMGGDCIEPDGGMGGSGGVPGCGALITSFSDGAFAKGTWDDGVVVTGRSAHYEAPVVTDPTSGGNPDAYRQVEMTVSATVDEGGAIWVAHALSAAVYDPADGAVCGIRMFLDGTDEFTGGQAIFSTFLFQDGTYYWGERLFVNANEWTTGQWPIDEFGYQKFFGLGPDVPDLTTRGGTIQFGFLTGTSRPAGTVGTSTNTYGADNFKVELYGPQ